MQEKANKYQNKRINNIINRITMSIIWENNREGNNNMAVKAKERLAGMS